MKIEQISEEQIKKSGFIAVRNGGEVELFVSFDSSDQDEPYGICESFLDRPPRMEFFSSLNETKAYIQRIGYGQDEFFVPGQKPTILEQTQEIRARYQRGDITPAEAKTLIKPYYDEYVRIAKEKAKAAGMKAPIMSLQKFLSRRSDLRYVAQEQASQEREEV